MCAERLFAMVGLFLECAQLCDDGLPRMLRSIELQCTNHRRVEAVEALLPRPVVSHDRLTIAHAFGHGCTYVSTYGLGVVGELYTCDSRAVHVRTSRSLFFGSRLRGVFCLKLTYGI